MKQVISIHSDMIDHWDKRFDLEVFRDSKQSQFPNTLPLFWKYDGKWIPCSYYHIEETDADIMAMVYPEDLSYEEVLDDLITFYELTIFDVSKLLILLEKYSKDPDRQSWCRKLNIPLRDWDKIRDLDTLSYEWKSYFISKNISYKRIRAFEDPELRKNIEHFLTLKPGINMLEQIAILLKELSIRDEVHYAELLKAIEVNSILEGDLSSAQKLAAIRAQLSILRYPVISRYREELKNRNSAFDRLNNLQLGIDETFETPGIEIKYLMKSSKDIDKLEQWLKTNKVNINSVLELQKGDMK